MKTLTAARISNIIGINRVEFAIGPCITLIAGPNRSGKTSALDAFAFAITGVKHRNLIPIGKNEVLAGEVLSESSVELLSDGEVVAAAVDGKLVVGGDHSRAAVIPGAYMSGKPADRIQFLLSACQIKIDAREALAGITGLTDEDAKSIQQRAQIDLDTAETWCRDQARKRKSKWQSITGEEWGAKKAERWKRQPPEGDVVDLQAQLEKNDAALAELRIRRAKLSEDYGAAVAAEDALKARKPGEIQAALDVLNAEIADLEKVTGTTGTIEPCPHCGEMVVRPAAGGPLAKAAGQAPDPRTQSILNACREEHRKLTAELGRAQACLELKAEHRPTGEIAAERAQCDSDGVKMSDLSRELQATIDTINGAKAATVAAAAEHLAIVALLAAAEELSPEGYRSRKLRAAVAMVNAAMPHFSDYSLRDDGGALWGAANRTVDWLSKSEQWRANAALSLALSAVSGATVVLLDALDVIEPADRMDVLRQIDDWARPRGVQVIISATLKGSPNIDFLTTHWMGG